MKKRLIRLLFLEDNPDDVRLISEFLRSDESLQFEVNQVNSLAAGLASLAEKTPEVILTDLGLPDSQGLDTFTRLHAAVPSIPIVVLTGIKDTQQAALVVNAGAQDYLNKDEVNGSFLCHTIRYAIERKQAVEALLQNEERFRLMFENTPVGYQSLDTKGCFLDVNTSFLDMLAYSRQEVIGHSFAEFLHPNQVALFQKRFPILTQSREVLQDIEFTLRRRNGSFMEASFTTRLVRDDSGRFIRTHSALQDISARKQSQRAIMLMVETQKQITGLENINEVCKLLGRSVQSLIGDGYVGVSHLDESSQTLKMIGFYGLGENYEKLTNKFNFDPLNFTFPVKNFTREDQNRFISSKLELYPDGLYNLMLKKIPKRICTLLEKELKLTGIYSMSYSWEGTPKGTIIILARSEIEPFREQIQTTVNQATLAMQRIHSQEALKASEERYRMLAETSPDMIFVIDREDRIQYVNNLASRQFGKTPEQVIGKPRTELFPPAIAESQGKSLKQVIRSGEALSIESLITFPGGQLWLDTQLIPLRDKSGPINAVMGVSRDISDRKQADQQIHLQAAALESAANAIVITDQDGSIQWVNPAYQKLTGYSLQEVAGLNPRILKSGLQHPEFYKNLWDTIISGKVWHSELVNKRKDGSLYTEEETITPLLDNAGQITHFIGIKQDITQRKQAEEALHRSENELRSLFAALPDVVLMFDRDGRYLKVTDSNQDLLYKPMEELVGKTLHDVFPLGEANLFNGYIQQVLNTSNTIHFEYSLMIADRETWFAATITPMTENTVIWVARDITENKKAELELQESEARLRESQRVSRIGSYVLDIATNIWTSSEVLNELFGIEPGFVKTLQSWNGLIHPDEQQEMLAYFKQDVVENRKPFNKEYRIIRPTDGAVRWMWGLGSLSFDKDGVPQKMVGTIQDITPRKLAEIAQQKSHSLLQATLESTADGILVVDLDGRITTTNQNFADMWDIHRDQLEGIDVSVSRNRILSKLKDPQAFMKKTLEIYADPAAESFDLIELKDERFVERVSRPQYQGTTIVGRVSSFRDVTERKRSEQAVHESEEKFKTLFNSASDAIFIMDRNVFLDCNTNTEKIFGCTREQIIGHSPAEFSPEKQPDGSLSSLKAIEKITAAFDGKPQFFEWVHTHLDGTPFFADISLNRVFISGNYVLQAIVRDISERKQAEDLVRESESKYRSLFDNVPDGVYRTTPDGQILAANKTLVSMLGYESAEEFIKISAYQMYENRNGRDKFLEEINKHGVVKNLEVQMRTAQGKAIVGLENTRAFRDENGEVIFYEGTLTDITERKQLEIERQTLLEIMQGLTSTDDLHEYLQVVHQAIAKVIFADNFFVVLKNKDTGMFEEPYFVDEFDQPGSSYDLGKSLTAYVFQSGKPYLNDRESFKALVKSGEVELVGYDSPSWLGVPLVVSRETIGVMVVQDYEREDQYSEQDVEFLTSISGQVAQAIRRKTAEAELEELYETEKRRSQRLSDLQILSAELNSLHTEQELLGRLVHKAALLSSSPVCTVMLLDEKTEDVILSAHYGLPGNTPDNLRIPVAHLPGAAQAFRSGQMILIPNIDRDMPAMRKVLVHPDVQAFFAFPLVLDGIVAGAITLSSMQPRQLSEAEVSTYQLLARLASAALDNVRMFEGVNRSLQRMSSLRRVDMAISASFDLVLTLNILLEQVTANLGVDAADILVFDPSDSTLKYACGRGFRSQALRYTNLRIGEGFAGQAAMERRTIFVPDLEREMNDLEKSMSLPSEGFVSYWGVPLVAKGNIQGVLEVFSRLPLQVDQDWINFMETLAGQAAIAVDNVLLFNHLERSNADLSLAYDSTLAGWATALELRDNETEGHTRRVATTTTQLAIKMGLRDKEIMYMRWGSLLHDIGKMGIPDSILLKPGPLSDEEWVVMRRHPVLAYEMLSPINYLANALDIPYNHHEKWDGSGYPRGLKGEQIPLSARIFAIIDVWDALTSDRPYRAAWSPEKTMEYIQEQVGTHFDPGVAAAFLEMVGADGKLP